MANVKFCYSGFCFICRYEKSDESTAIIGIGIGETKFMSSGPGKIVSLSVRRSEANK